MQEHTNPGGYTSLSVPWIRRLSLAICPSRSPFKGELWRLQDWELSSINENPGHLHRRDENGHRIQLRFATMLAKKK